MVVLLSKYKEVDILSDNSVLNNAKHSSNTDEWYTTYETISEELVHYKEHFYNKTVLCNCDDPFESNFCYYFLRNFNVSHLRKLICTSYSKSKILSINGNVQLKLPILITITTKLTIQMDMYKAVVC